MRVKPETVFLITLLLDIVGPASGSAQLAAVAVSPPAASAPRIALGQPSSVVIRATIDREVARLGGSATSALPRETLTRMVVARLAAGRSPAGGSRDPGAVSAAVHMVVHEVVAEQALRARLSALPRPAPPRTARPSIIVHASAISAGERGALIDLYNSTNGAGWTRRDNWRNAADSDFNAPGTECTWYGVTCDAGETTVVQLDLHDINLVGTLPATLGSLTNLQYLRLSDNGLTGSIPPELGNLASLEGLHLYRNQLTGAIPAQLGNLTSLTWLNLFANQLTGSIPAALGNLTKLQGLIMSENQLTGSLPAELGNLTNLQFLSLAYNGLTGSIPPELGNLANLTELYLYVNELTGPIPPELGNLTNLTVLLLRTNQLTGPIPIELGALTNLSELYLNNNELTGPIPPELGNLTNLSELYLSNNQLMGSIPAQLGNLASLESLSLDGDQLTGSIPAQLGSLTSLTDLYLTGNQLTGAIPAQLGSLTNLQGLHLTANQLTGSIPPELGNLTNLTELFLDINQLTGSIPPELGNLTNLEGLVLTGNQLTGSIPPQLGNLTNLQYLVLSENQLTGSIPPELGNLGNLSKLYLANNHLTGPIPAQLGNLTSFLFWNLDLHSNQLTGAVPGSITSLTGLRSDTWNVTDLRWNGLYSSDPAVVALLNGAQTGGDWQSTQTVPVTGLAAGVATSSSVGLTWTPIAYAGDTGGYQVSVATVSGGPYTPSATTADKTAAAWQVTGLSPGTPYYFIVESVTSPHVHNQNTVVSDPSAEVPRSTPAALAITTASPLPAGAVGHAYSQTFASTAGAGGPYSWSVISGSLPAGLLLSSGGVLGGDPTTAGNSSFTVQVMDVAGNTGSAPFTLQVGASLAAIPALGEWGRLVSLLLVLLIGVDVLRRIRGLA